MGLQVDANGNKFIDACPFLDKFSCLPYGKQTKAVGNGQSLPVVGGIMMLVLLSCELVGESDEATSD